MTIVTVKTKRARNLRQSDNDAEDRLWIELRNRRLHGNKFVPQLPIGPYFADFACRESKLVIEVDGSQHVESQYDEKRNSFMTAHGWSVVRFWNVDIFKDMDSVLGTILAVLDGRLVEKPKLLICGSIQRTGSIDLRQASPSSACRHLLPTRNVGRRRTLTGVCRLASFSLRLSRGEGADRQMRGMQPLQVVVT